MRVHRHGGGSVRGRLYGTAAGQEKVKPRVSPSGKDEIKAFHHEEGLKAMKPARERLDRAGITYTLHIGVGNAAPVIAHYRKEKQCQQIFMSEHAGGSANGLWGMVSSIYLRCP